MNTSNSTFRDVSTLRTEAEDQDGDDDDELADPDGFSWNQLVNDDSLAGDEC